MSNFTDNMTGKGSFTRNREWQRLHIVHSQNFVTNYTDQFCCIMFYIPPSDLNYDSLCKQVCTQIWTPLLLWRRKDFPNATLELWKWIFKNPFQEYSTTRSIQDKDTDETLIESYYPCIKYKILTDLDRDGTDSFIIFESMHSNRHIPSS